MTTLPENPEVVRLSIGDHLDELRTRLFRSFLWTFVAFIGCFLFAEEIMAFLLHPVLLTLEDLGMARFVIHTSVQEKFISYLKVSGVAAILVSAPIWSYHAWMFVGAGLFPHERKALGLFIPLSVFNFAAGVGFFYAIVMPWGLRFLLGFGEGSEGGYAIQPFIRISELLSFFVSLSLVFGVVFETPLVMLALCRLGLFTAADYASKRRFAVLVGFVAGALLTPPDIFTQVVLAIPLIGLYEVGILVSRSRALRSADGRSLRIDLRGVLWLVAPGLIVVGLVVAHGIAFGRREAPPSIASWREGSAIGDLMIDLEASGVDRSALEAHEARVRYEGLRALIARGIDPDEIDGILRDPDPGVRLRGAAYLLQRGRPEGGRSLLEALRGGDRTAAYLAGRLLHEVDRSVEAPPLGAPDAVREAAAAKWKAILDR